MRDTEYGEALVERVDEAIALGEGTSLLELAGAEADDPAPRVPPAALFDAFAYARNAEARRRLERWFRLVAPPGAPLRVDIAPGDLLVRRALGDGGLAHVALIAAPEREPLDRALAGGWRVEGLRPGAYVRVLEAGPRPCLLRDRFARRLLDARGWLPLDTLVLRPAHAAPDGSSAGGGRWLPYEEDFGGLAEETTDWSKASDDDRMLYVMERLVDQYRFPVNGAAGLVGNLRSESGVIPSRIEGSAIATPLRAPAFGGGTRDFTADEVMNRNLATRQGPRLPGIGLAQWTSPARRAGLFQHVYQGRPAGSGILFDMDAQIDYLVTELQGSYAPVYRLLTGAGVTVNDAADAVVYRFEVPGSILQDGRRLPRTDPRVQEVFAARRSNAQRALSAYRAAHPATEALPAVAGGRTWRGGERYEDAGALAAETTVLVRVTVRTDFTVRGAAGVTFDWSPGEPVARANVEIVGTAIRGTTNAAGAVDLDTTALADGAHTVRVTHADADRSSNDEAGPATASSLAPPNRIYRPLDIQITTASGLLTSATVAAPHGGIGNRTHHDRTGNRLPIDWKPVWMASPLKTGEGPRATTGITLVVVHQPGGSQAGPVINTFLNATEDQNANYVIDVNGHIIKMAEEGRLTNQAGASRWGGTTWVNAFSVGIEVVQPVNGFRDAQYLALTRLLQRLRTAHPTIAAHRVVGHSDIATSRADLFTLDDRRANDPGLDFDWARLETAGLGMQPALAEWARVAERLLFRSDPWFPLREGDHDRRPGVEPRYGGAARPGVPAGVELIRELQEDLEHIGYTLRPPTGALGRYTLATRRAVDRFQRHFFAGSRASIRSGVTLGVADANTRAWIRAVRVNIP